MQNGSTKKLYSLLALFFKNMSLYKIKIIPHHRSVGVYARRCFSTNFYISRRFCVHCLWTLRAWTSAVRLLVVHSKVRLIVVLLKVWLIFQKNKNGSKCLKLPKTSRNAKKILKKLVALSKVWLLVELLNVRLIVVQQMFRP